MTPLRRSSVAGKCPLAATAALGDNAILDW
jgi:hypothetical protein